MEEINYKPKYEHLKDLLLTDVIESLPVHAQVPPQRALMHKYGLSYATVTRSLKDLEDEGYIYRIQGKGTFKSDRELQPDKIEDPADIHEKLSKDIKDIWVVFFSRSDKTNYIVEFLQGVERVSPTLGCNIHTYTTRSRSIIREKNSPLKHLILSGHIDGLILVSPFPEEDPAWLYKQGVPFVVLGFDYKNLPRISRVMLDNREAVRLGVEYLASKGYRELGAIIGQVSRKGSAIRGSADELYDALHEYALEYGMRLQKKFIKDGPYVNGFEMMEKMLETNSCPSAVFIDGDIIYNGAIKALKLHGVSLDSDILLLNYIDNRIHNRPPMLCKPLVEAGEISTKLLAHQMMYGDERAKGQIISISPTFEL